VQWVKKQRKIKSLPRHLETRVVTRFLWLPKELNGVVKWLQFAKITQKYFESKMEQTGGYDLFGHASFTFSDGGWYDQNWTYQQDEC
jgi:hypothetical protein